MSAITVVRRWNEIGRFAAYLAAALLSLADLPVAGALVLVLVILSDGRKLSAAASTAGSELVTMTAILTAAVLASLQIPQWEWFALASAVSHTLHEAARPRDENHRLKR